MKVKDMMKKGGRIYFKSDWAPISDIWPCFSFTKKHVGIFLQKNYIIGRDVAIYVGTSNPKNTKNPLHRQRLIFSNINRSQHIITNSSIFIKRDMGKDCPRIWSETMAILSSS